MLTRLHDVTAFAVVKTLFLICLSGLIYRVVANDLQFGDDFYLDDFIFYDASATSPLSLNVSDKNVTSLLKGTIFDDDETGTKLSCYNYSSVFISFIFNENYLINSIRSTWSPYINLDTLYVNYFDIGTQSWINSNDNTSNFVIEKGNITNTNPAFLIDLEYFIFDASSTSLITNEMTINITFARSDPDLELATLTFDGEISFA